MSARRPRRCAFPETFRPFSARSVPPAMVRLVTFRAAVIRRRIVLKLTATSSQLRMRNEGHPEGVIQTSGTKDDGPSAGAAPQHRHAIPEAGVLDDLIGDRACCARRRQRVGCVSQVRQRCPGGPASKAWNSRHSASRCSAAVTILIADTLVHDGSGNAHLSRLCGDNATGFPRPRRDAALPGRRLRQRGKPHALVGPSRACRRRTRPRPGGRRSSACAAAMSSSRAARLKATTWQF